MPKRPAITRNLSVIVAACTLSAGSAFAQTPSPVGLWKTIDDETGKPKALFRIVETNGEMHGRVEQLFPASGEEKNPVCEKCEGALKNQPIIGMTILSGMKREESGYGGGQIIDPANGKTYRSKMTLSADGATLAVRGYIGTPMLGRTQTWQRVD